MTWVEVNLKEEQRIKYLIRFVLVAVITIGCIAVENNPPREVNAEVNLNKQDVAVVESQSKSQAVTPQPVEPAQVVSEPPVVVQPTVPVEAPQPLTTREIGQQMAAEAGFTGSQWSCLEKLWTGESNWRTEAYNQSSGAGGIPQSLPMSKMASAGADYETNPRTQISWGLTYITSRYNTPCEALSFWNNQSPHWY